MSTKNYLKERLCWFTDHFDPPGDEQEEFDTARKIAQNKVISIDILEPDNFTVPENVVDSWNAAKDDGYIMCYEIVDTAEPEFLKLYIVGDNICIADATMLFCYFTNVKEINGLRNIDFSETSTLYAMFYDCQKLESIDIDWLDTSRITDLSLTFAGCRSLKKLDVSHWDVSNVTSFRALFQGYCHYYEDGSWEPFSELVSLDLGSWNTSSATDMSYMFWGCIKLPELDISNFNVSAVKNFDHFLCHCKLPYVDTSRWANSVATNLNAMFHSNQMEVIDLRGFDTSNVVYFSQLFDACTNLKKIYGIEQFNTSKGIRFEEMFLGCNKLRKLDLSSFDTSSVINNKDLIDQNQINVFAGMFGHCHNLYEIKFGPKFVYLPSEHKVNNHHPQYFLPAPIDIFKEEGYCGLYESPAQGDGYHSYIEGADLLVNNNSSGLYSADQAANIGIYYDNEGNCYSAQYIREVLLAAPRANTITLFANKYGKEYSNFNEAISELAIAIKSKKTNMPEIPITINNMVNLYTGKYQQYTNFNEAMADLATAIRKNKNWQSKLTIGNMVKLIEEQQED